MVETGEPPWDDIADDFVWDMSADEMWVERQEYVGRAGMLEFIRSWRGTWDDWNLEVLDAKVLGEEIVALRLRQSGFIRDSGVPIEMEFGQLWMGEGGMARRMVMCSSFEDAIERGRAAAEQAAARARD